MRDYFTIAPRLLSHKGFSTFSLTELHQMITAKTGVIRSLTLDIERNFSRPKYQKELKFRLPVVLINGVFKQRTAEDLIEYSKYIIIDLDYDLPQQIAQRDADLIRVKANPYARMVFLSPRRGIKVLVEHDNPNQLHHSELYEAIATQLGTQMSVDPNCKDIPRACFISYDPDATLNTTSQVFHFTPSTKACQPQPRLSSAHPPQHTSIGKLRRRYNMIFKPQTLSDSRKIMGVLKMVLKWSAKKFPVSKGYRNANLFRVACLLHDHGVSQKDAVIYLTLKYVASDFRGDEIENIILNAYK